jgi:hypothetical protein
MATESKKTSDLPVETTIRSADRIVLLSDPSGVPSTATLSYSNFFANVAVTAKFGGNTTLNVATANTLSTYSLKVTRKSTPIASGDAETEGTIWFDNTYLYIATANNVIKRVALTSF